MRRIVVVLLLVLTGASARVDAQFDYLKEMPSAEAVKAAFSDPDPKMAAGKQIAAFMALQEIGRTFIGRYDALQDEARLSLAERALFASYRTSILQIRATPGIDADEASALAMRISFETEREVRQRFFSREWQAAFGVAQKKFELHLQEVRAADDAAARKKADATARRTPQPAPMDPDNPGAAQIAVNWFWQLIYLGVPIGLFVIWWKFRFNPNAEIAANSARELARLGTTVAERTKRIDHLFTHRSESLTFDLKNKTPDRKWATASMTRSIAAMPQREREVLRALYHLFNAGFTDPANFYWTRLALIYGDGKAQVTQSDPPNFGAVLKQLTSVTSEGAVSLVLDWVGRAATAQQDHPVMKQLAERLFGGGGASLSSAESFVAAHGKKQPALVLGLSDETGAPVTYGGDGSAITIAPPRTGKSLSQVFPTLLTWNGPAVVLDVKGEIYEHTSKWRSEHVGPVYRFAPLDPANSHRYNPLAAVRTDPEFVWEDARFLADMMIVPTESKDTFWQDGARDVLTAAIARACLHPDESQRSTAAVLDVFHGVGWDTFLKDLEARSDIRSMRRAASSLASMDRKTLDGVLKTGLTSLSAWDGDRIDRATRSSDWSPADLRTGENPTIYLCLTTEQLRSYLSIMRVLLAQHIRGVMKALPPKGSLPILFILDELPQLRHMPPVEEGLNVGAGFGIRLWMFAQSVGQMKESYPNADGMIGACAVRMFMNPSQHDGTAQKLSDDIGMQEGVLDGQRQKIVEANVLAGEEYRDHVIVMPSGFKPFRLRKNFASQNPELASRMGQL